MQETQIAFEAVAAQDLLISKILIEAELTPEQVVNLMIISKFFNQALKCPTYWQAVVKRTFPAIFQSLGAEPGVNWFQEYQRALDAHYQGLDRRVTSLFLAVNIGDLPRLQALNLSYHDLYLNDKQDVGLIDRIAQSRHQPVMDYIFNGLLAPYYRTLVVRQTDPALALMWVENNERLTLVHQAARLNQAAIIRQWPSFLVATISNAVISREERTPKPHMPAQLAAINGHVEALDALMSAGAKMDCPGSSDYTPFQYAVSTGQIEIMAYLHRKHIHIHAPRWNKMTPLRIAISSGQAEAFTYLLAHGASLLDNQSGETLLLDAVAGGNDSILKMIIDTIKPLDLNVKNAAGKTPLHLAAGMGSVAMCDRLIKAGASVEVVSYDGETLLHFAARSGNRHLAEKVYEAKKLLIAARSGSRDLVKKVYEAKKLLNFVDAKNVKGFTALHAAISVNKRLTKRVQREIVGVIDYLVSQGADVNACASESRTFAINETPLHIAARACNIPAMQKLIIAGANVNAQTVHGYTALHYVLSSHLDEQTMLDAMDCLLMYDADINITTFTIVNDQGSQITPLWYARIKNYSLRVHEWLLNRGANPDVVNASGNTLLHDVARAGSAELLTLLLERGANAHIKNQQGLTPLGVLLYSGNVRGNYHSCLNQLMSLGGFPVENELELLTELTLYFAAIKKETLLSLLLAMPKLEKLDLTLAEIVDEPSDTLSLPRGSLPRLREIKITGMSVSHPILFMHMLILAASNLTLIEDNPYSRRIMELPSVVIEDDKKEKLLRGIYAETKHPYAALTLFGSQQTDDEKRSLEEASDSSAKRQKKRE